MTQNIDDFEAVRTIAKMLEPFEQNDRERIIRWALEKLGQTILQSNQTFPLSSSQTANMIPTNQSIPINLNNFIEEKKPQTDIHFATTVAYYYKFVAPPEKTKENINKEDILEACRLTNFRRPKKPDQTLRDAYAAGLLNRGEKGVFAINTVGENLVAMTLPGTLTKKPKKTAKNKKKLSKNK